MTPRMFELSAEICFWAGRVAAITTVILLAALAAVAWCRRRSAATRHGLWLAAVLGCLLAPLFAVLAPAPTLEIAAIGDSSAAQSVGVLTTPDAAPQANSFEQTPPQITSKLEAQRSPSLEDNPPETQTHLFPEEAQSSVIASPSFAPSADLNRRSTVNRHLRVETWCSAAVGGGWSLRPVC